MPWKNPQRKNVENDPENFELGFFFSLLGAGELRWTEQRQCLGVRRDDGYGDREGFTEAPGSKILEV